MNYYSAIGLVIDILGVLVLFEYGLPSKYKEGEEHHFEETEGEEGLRTKKNRKVKIMSTAGLMLIILGFALQFFGLIPCLSNSESKSICSPKHQHHCHCNK